MEVKVLVFGWVINFFMCIGDYVSIGKLFFVLVDSYLFYVMGYFEEIKLCYICEGEFVLIILYSGNVKL